MKYLTANKNRPIEQQLDSVDEYRWPDGLKLAMLMAFVLTIFFAGGFLAWYIIWTKMYGV